MSRRFRAWSKSSMLRALSAANLDRARQARRERWRWYPRLMLAFAAGLAAGATVALALA